MTHFTARHSLLAGLLGLAACSAGARPDDKAQQSRAILLDSVSDPGASRLVADRPFRDPVHLDGPTLVLFAPRRGDGDTALTAEGLQIQLLADSVAALAAELGVRVLLRTPPFLTFRAPGRLIPGPTIQSAATGFILGAPDTRLTITPGLPSPEQLRLAVRHWHAEWLTLHRPAPGARAT